MEIIKPQSQPQIKLIAIDIDGTLLNPQKEITPRTRAAIQAALEAGISVTLATARRYGNSSQFADELGLSLPLIVCDGALIVHYPDNTILHTHTLHSDIAQQVVEIMVRHNVQPVVQQMNGTVEEIWTGNREFDNPDLAAYFNVFPDHLRRMPHAMLCAGQPDPLRVVAFATEKDIDALIPEITQVPCAWNTVKRGNYGSAEISIMDQMCSKASGVTALSSYLGIPLEQVMAIGDNTNDLEMLQAVGWGVAMGHAPEHVKAIASAITANNIEDGVALAIERYALPLATKADSNSLKRATCL